MNRHPSQRDVLLMANKRTYYQELQKFYKNNPNIKPWNKSKIYEITQALLSEQKKAQIYCTKRLDMFYRRNYEIIQIKGEEILIKRRSTGNDEIVYVTPYEQFFDKIKHAHEMCKHGIRKETKATLSSLQYWVPWEAVDVYIKCCTTCNKLKLNKSKITKTTINRGQFDILDYRLFPDGEFKWLLHYKDIVTEFLHLRPLKTNEPKEIAQELLKIFLQFGAPEALHSGKTKHLSQSVICHLKVMWPTCKILNGNCNYTNPNFLANQNIRVHLKQWLEANSSTNWSIGCYFVEMQKNCIYKTHLHISPYKALFGVDFPAGLSRTKVPPALFNVIQTEEELNNYFNNKLCITCLHTLSIEEMEEINGQKCNLCRQKEQAKQASSYAHGVKRAGEKIIQHPGIKLITLVSSMDVEKDEPEFVDIKEVMAMYYG